MDLSPFSSLRKYVFIQDDPFYLPKMLDKYLREFCDSTVGVNIQPTVMGNRTTWGTARSLLKIYGFRYFQWKLCRYLAARVKQAVLWRPACSRAALCSVRAVARKYGVPVDKTRDVNSSEFRALLRERKVELIVSISGTQFYGRRLREQTPHGILNCHGGLLPRYRGLMPSFWTLANGEREGGVTVHYVDGEVDNGPIVLQRRYRIHSHDTLEEIMGRSKDLAAETLIDAVRLVEAGSAVMLPNPHEEASSYSVPTREDAKRFLARGHRFV